MPQGVVSAIFPFQNLTKTLAAHRKSIGMQIRHLAKIGFFRSATLTNLNFVIQSMLDTKCNEESKKKFQIHIKLNESLKVLEITHFPTRLSLVHWYISNWQAFALTCRMVRRRPCFRIIINEEEVKAARVFSILTVFENGNSPRNNYARLWIFYQLRQVMR